MYEYVITKGEGIMLEHGVCSLEWIRSWATPVFDEEICVMYAIAPRATKTERFH